MPFSLRERPKSRLQKGRRLKMSWMRSLKAVLLKVLLVRVMMRRKSKVLAGSERVRRLYSS
jgi:hypothetical protein